MHAVQSRQGNKVSSVEEIAYRKGYINRAQLEALASEMIKNDYGQYLMDLARSKDLFD